MVCSRWTPVTAVQQLDVVGPEGEFERSVSDMMARESGMTVDVAEMLVAANTMSADGTVDCQTEKLNRALRTMDEVQRTAASLFDSTYDDCLDLYPAWRMYILCEDPVQRNHLYRDYRRLLKRFIKGQESLMEELGYLIALEKALLPSNTYPDPYGRIKPSADITDILENFA